MFPGRLPQGSASDASGGEIRTSRDLLRGHPGAACGVEAEERGQGEAIARNIYEMSALKVPVLSVIIGEGGSGGALALAVGNEVWMLENSVYSILSPEGFASILWKDSKRAKHAGRMYAPHGGGAEGFRHGGACISGAGAFYRGKSVPGDCVS